jgi:phosphohistidine phosphatase
MELILLRHGKAEDLHAAGDYSRELVEKGRHQARNAAKALKAAGLLPEIVLCSPLKRARQTAEEFCKAGHLAIPTVQAWLACGMQPAAALRELTEYADFKRVAIIGHEPDFSQLIEWLLGAENNRIEMKKGSIACLEVSPPRQWGILHYVLPPKLIDL